MSLVAAAALRLDRPQPTLRPGAAGWSAADLLDPGTCAAYAAGRFEIHHAVLTQMPASHFYGGACAMNVVFAARDHFKAAGIRHAIAPEPDIQVRPDLVVRADFAVALADDLDRIKAQRFARGPQDWRRQIITLPPTLVVESVSPGHAADDRVNKRRWYADLGVPNYWIVDALARRLDALRLAPDGTYADDAAGRNADTVRPSAFPGLQIALADAWEL